MSALFEPLPGTPHDARAEERAKFLQRFFELNRIEKTAALERLKNLILRVASQTTGDLRALDVGCGQGHMFEQLIPTLPEAVVKRLAIDFLDPQRSNLVHYRQRLARIRLENEYCMRWEEFVAEPNNTDCQYDLIFVFQALYSLKLELFGWSLPFFATLLSPDGAAAITHCTTSSAYFRLLRDLGPLFHQHVPHLNTAEDLLRAFKVHGVLLTVHRIPVCQVISQTDLDDLWTYIAGCVYLAAPQTIRARWEDIRPYIDRHHLRPGGHYEFQQEIALLEIGKSKERRGGN